LKTVLYSTVVANVYYKGSFESSITLLDSLVVHRMIIVGIIMSGMVAQSRIKSAIIKVSDIT